MTTTPRQPSVVSRVMVVDDSAAIRRILAVRLRHEGFEVVEARSGEEALDRFQREPAQVVVTDVGLPGLGGLDLLADLLRLPIRPEVILLTGLQGDATVAAQQARLLGAHEYIPKTPAALDSVVLAVEQALEKRRLDAQNALGSGAAARSAELTPYREALTGAF